MVPFHFYHQCTMILLTLNLYSFTVTLITQGRMVEVEYNHFLVAGMCGLLMYLRKLSLVRSSSPHLCSPLLSWTKPLFFSCSYWHCSYFPIKLELDGVSFYCHET